MRSAMKTGDVILIGFRGTPSVVCTLRTGLRQIKNSQVYNKLAESWPQQTLVVKTGSESSPAKRSATGASVTGSHRSAFSTDALCISKCGMLRNPYSSVTMIASWVKELQPFTRKGGISI